MNADCTGRFELDDAPYVLGLLSREESRHFEVHLAQCVACRARVDELTHTAALLAELDPADVAAVAAGPEPIPDTTLAAVLRTAQSTGRRRVAVLAGLVAACLAVLIVTQWPTSTAPSNEAHRMVAVASTPLTASATLAADSAGTRITLACHYASQPGYSRAEGTYLLTVVDTAGATHDLGSWNISPGADTEFSSGVALPRSAIREVRVTTSGHRPVLSLTL